MPNACRCPRILLAGQRYCAGHRPVRDVQFLSADQTRNKVRCLLGQSAFEFHSSKQPLPIFFFFLSAAQPQHPVSRFPNLTDRQATMPRPIEADVHSAFMEFRNAGIFTLPFITPSLPPSLPRCDPYQWRVVTSYIWYYSVTVPYTACCCR